MIMSFNVKRLAATTALAAVIASPGVAQDTFDLTDDQIAILTDECQILARELRVRDTLPDEVTEDDALLLVQNDDAARCDEVYVAYFEADAQASDVATARIELSQEALIEGLARVRVPEPEVDVDIPAPNVRVMAGQPSVRVEQGESTIEIEQAQPEISVEIPEIIVRVEIPAPKIFIRSDEPNVTVSSADPQIEVMQDEPRITVTQAEPTIDLDLGLEAGDVDTANTGTATTESEGSTGGEVRVARAEPTVMIERSDAQPDIQFAFAEPQVSYSGSEPNVTVTMAEQPSVVLARVGDIEVTFETDEEREQRRATVASDTGMTTESDVTETETASTGGDTSMLTIGDLMAMEVKGADGNDLGSPEAFVRQDGKLMMVLSSGGFLGIGDKEVIVPLSRVGFTEDALTLQTMTEDELDDARAFQFDETMRVSDDLKIRVGG